jgi:Asp-tRNA(Asn)/Glu-tRNA(Gln) amidotransferase A subunit family amidase
MKALLCNTVINRIKGLSFTGDPVFCALWSFLGTPSITLPFTKSSNGIPLGIQLIGNYKEDAKLLSIAKFSEESFGQIKASTSFKLLIQKLAKDQGLFSILG